MTTTTTGINKKYKDRLFNFIYGNPENKEWTLSLYNAVNGSDYTDPSLIEFNTLSDVLFMGMQNDTSFIIFDIMSVYEHQSTLNYNMPLRMLQYVGELYSGHIAKHKLNKYGQKRIMLPVPKLVVFYNGGDYTEDEVILRLSDSFNPDYRETADVEVKVRMINVNYGRNKELMKNCKTLNEYAWFVACVLKNLVEHDIKAAVNIALDEMPQNFVIRDFLFSHRQEVEGMLDTEYNEAEVMELFRADGEKQGIDKHLITLICKKIKAGKHIEEIANEVEESVEDIAPIYNIAIDFAPDYSVERIYEKLKEEK
ncbi:MULTISPECIES: Rpn family recombination-promoting nuclease/putative transposase [unclassified Butyrivibrio]|uniref:Rpn family recombination-promoting nuclease/putative transposase n=1 Tax=unclassified Butyrivibrio TaxID=2639466 RepID=UPI0003B7B44D|nr:MULTISPECIES: Rpn family recombination-promoting nuclease/putative transposase [unclassified Butyrivibrio]MDC7294389.1 Rpn family recombination-promoting nuclease/putative transposase [Butyrivibrio sp. DSM 10294]